MLILAVCRARQQVVGSPRQPAAPLPVARCLAARRPPPAAPAPRAAPRARAPPATYARPCQGLNKTKRLFQALGRHLSRISSRIHPGRRGEFTQRPKHRPAPRALEPGHDGTITLRSSATAARGVPGALRHPRAGARWEALLSLVNGSEWGGGDGATFREWRGRVWRRRDRGGRAARRINAMDLSWGRR
jgi:hypothetical protein